MGRDNRAMSTTIYVLEETLYGPTVTDRNLIGAWYTKADAQKECVRMIELRKRLKQYEFMYSVLAVELRG